MDVRRSHAPFHLACSLALTPLWLTMLCIIPTHPVLPSRSPASAFGLGQRSFQARSLQISPASQPVFRTALSSGGNTVRAAAEQAEPADAEMKILFVEMGVGYDQHG